MRGFVDFYVENEAEVAETALFIGLTGEQKATAKEELGSIVGCRCCRRTPSPTEDLDHHDGPRTRPARSGPRAHGQAIAVAAEIRFVGRVRRSPWLLRGSRGRRHRHHRRHRRLAAGAGDRVLPRGQPDRLPVRHPVGAAVRRARFGVLPLVTATLWTTVIALVTAVPLGLGAAVLLSEYAPARARKVLKPILEVLAGVPTVVYGLFALEFVQTVFRELLGLPTGSFSVLAAGLVMGVMIVPTVASLSEDAMSAVPNGMRQGSAALGANRMQTSVRVVFPAALSGIVAAVVLGISRAVGETMIVAIAAGGQARMVAGPLEQGPG